MKQPIGLTKYAFLFSMLTWAIVTLAIGWVTLATFELFGEETDHSMYVIWTIFIVVEVIVGCLAGLRCLINYHRFKEAGMLETANENVTEIDEEHWT